MYETKLMEKRDKNTVFFLSRRFVVSFYISFPPFSIPGFVSLFALTLSPPLSLCFCFSVHSDALMNATKYTYRDRLINSSRGEENERKKEKDRITNKHIYTSYSELNGVYLCAELVRSL